MSERHGGGPPAMIECFEPRPEYKQMNIIPFDIPLQFRHISLCGRDHQHLMFPSEFCSTVRCDYGLQGLIR